MASFSKSYDVEAADEKPVYGFQASSKSFDDEGAVHAEALIVGDSWYAKTQRFVTQYGVEARGIERVPSDERTDSGMSKIGTLVSIYEESIDLEIDLQESQWLSANMYACECLEVCEFQREINLRES